MIFGERRQEVLLTLLVLQLHRRLALAELVFPLLLGQQVDLLLEQPNLLLQAVAELQFKEG